MLTEESINWLQVEEQIKQLEQERDALLEQTPFELLSEKRNKRNGVVKVTTHSKIRIKYNTMIACLRKHGVTSIRKLKSAREKEHATKLAKYDTLFLGDRDKSRQTKLSKGSNGKQWVNSEKAKQTKQSKYGDSSYVNSEKAKQTKLDNGITIGHESFKRGVATRRMLYGDNMELIVEKIRQTCQERYGVNSYVETDACKYAKGAKTISSHNINLQNELKSMFDVNFALEYRIDNYAYDLQYNNLLIDINPVWTHNSTIPYDALTNRHCCKNKIHPKDYHFNRTQVALNAKYHCIAIWDWDDRQKVLDLIRRCLNKVPNHVGARQCILRQISQKDAKRFEDLYHLQGQVHSQPYCFGLFYKDTLVQVMTFGKTRHGRRANTNEYELLRMCTHKDYEVYGGFAKLFTHFIKTYKPEKIISYCDLSKFTGSVYQKLGFVYQYTTIGKHWYNINTYQHVHDNTLRQLGADRLIGTCYGKGTDNELIMLANNWVEIYDCGQATWLWTSAKEKA